MESLLYYESPIGLLRLRAEDAGLCGIDPVRSREDAEQPSPLLRRAAGHIRSELGRRMHIRRSPELLFIEDDGSAYAAHINELIRELEDE